MATDDDKNGTGAGKNTEALNAEMQAGLDLYNTYQKILEQKKDLKTDAKILKSLNEDLAAAERELAEVIKATGNATNDDVKYQQERIDAIKGAIEQVGALKKANDDLATSYVSQSEAVGVLSSALGSLGGNLPVLGKAFSSLGSVTVAATKTFDKFKEKGKELKQQQEDGIISPEEFKKLERMNMIMAGMAATSAALKPLSDAFDSVLTKTIELAVNEIDAEKNLQKLYQTGEEAAIAFGKIEESTAGPISSLNEIGIETGKLYNTFEELRGEFLLVRNEEGKFNKELIASAAVLERVGIAVKDTGATVNTLTRVFETVTEDAVDFAAELNAIGVQAGLGPGELVTTFNQLSPQLLKITGGTSALTQTMNDLAYISRQTGIEIGRIVDFASGFDTFEGAADRVGKLNAILGGDFLNVMDLMAEEDPATRFKMISDAINKTAGSFDELTYYERLALAEAGGFKDVGELAVAMSGDFDQFGDSLVKTQEDYVAAAEKAKEFQTFQEQIQSTMVALAKQEGFSQMVMDGINGFLTLMQFVAAHGKTFVMILVAAKAATLGLAAAQLVLSVNSNLSKTALGVGLLPILVVFGTMLAIGMSPPLIDTVLVFAAAILAMGVAARIAGTNFNMGLVKVMLALGAAVLLAAVGIALAAEGIGSMADSISKLNSEQIGAFNNALIGLVGTLVLFGAAIIALGIFATGPQMLGILGIAAAFFLIGAAIGIAGAGMGLMAEGFAKLFATGASGGALLGMAAGLYAMAGSLTVFAAAMAILTPAMLMFQGALAVGKLLGVGPKGDEIESFSRMVESLASINPSNLSKTVEQVKQLREEMSNMMESPDMVKDFTDMLKVFERDMKLSYNLSTKAKADQKAELTITSPITIKIDESLSLTGRIDERILLKKNFTRP